MKNKILSTLILIVFFGGIAGAVAFRNTDQRVSAIFVGAVFFLVGLLIFIDQKLSLRNAPVLIFCVVGALMIGIPLWLILAEKYPDSFPQPTDDLTKNLAGMICILIGVCIAVFPTLAELHNRRVCTESVMATCVMVKSRIVRGKNGSRRVYCPVWEFYYDGNTYTAEENSYSGNSRFEVGEVQEIFCNPLDPQEIYRKVKGTILSVMIFGAVFATFGILICCL